MSQIAVRKVESKADFKVFFEFPWKVYADNPYWVPPLKSTRRHLLDREHDAAWEYLEGEFFVAWRGDDPVGTITAFVNHHHNEKWKENMGWFGSFDFFDDPEIAKALLKTAEDYLHAKDCKAVRGPATFTLHSEVAVLLDNYDKPPILLMPYNHPYYPHHIEAAGYSKIKDLHTWQANLEHIYDEGGVAHRYGKIAQLTEKIMQRRNITVRRGDPKNKRRDFEIIYELYNAGWADNWGFVELTRRELDAMIKELSQVYDPKMSVYAFVNDDPAGFFIGVPDLNQALRLAYPRPSEPEIFTLLKVLWHWKLRPKINTVRLPLGGIKPIYRKTGVIMALAWHFFDCFRNTNWKHFDGGWVLEDNDDLNDVMLQSRAQIGRRYRIYQKSL